jgi:hypothetical protein
MSVENRRAGSPRATAADSSTVVVETWRHSAGGATERVSGGVTFATEGGALKTIWTEDGWLRHRRK